MRIKQKKRNHIEETHQVNIIQWASMTKIPKKHCLAGKIVDHLVASANGGARNEREGYRLKAQGVMAGFPDLQLFIASNGYHGLFIELKKPRVKRKPPPRVSKEQKIVLTRLNEAGYKAIICYGFDEATEAIICYLS